MSCRYAPWGALEGFAGSDTAARSYTLRHYNYGAASYRATQGVTSRNLVGTYTFASEPSRCNWSRRTAQDPSYTDREPSTRQEADIVSSVKAFLTRVIAMLDARHPTDFRTLAIKRVWTGVVRVTDGDVAASNCAGVMYVNPSNENVQTPSRMRAIALHELAHCVGIAGDGTVGAASSHDLLWQDAFVWLLNVVADAGTEEVRVECNTCKKYGTCYPQQCPKCTFEPAPGGTCSMPYYQKRAEELGDAGGGEEEEEQEDPAEEEEEEEAVDPDTGGATPAPDDWIDGGNDCDCGCD